MNLGEELERSIALQKKRAKYPVKQLTWIDSSGRPKLLPVDIHDNDNGTCIHWVTAQCLSITEDQTNSNSKLKLKLFTFKLVNTGDPMRRQQQSMYMYSRTTTLAMSIFT